MTFVSEHVSENTISRTCPSGVLTLYIYRSLVIKHSLILDRLFLFYGAQIHFQEEREV